MFDSAVNGQTIYNGSGEQPLPHRQTGPLSQMVVNCIVDDLISQRLVPGAQLPTETEMCQKYGVSRNTVREAVKMLAVLGVVTIKRGDGTYIAESISTSAINPLLLGLALEPRTSKEMVELRQLLDVGASELVISKASDAEIDELEAINNAIMEKTHHASLDELFELDLRFHSAFHAMTGNRMLVYLYETIYRMFAPSIKDSVAANPASIYANHAVIIKALRSRDAKMVRKAILGTLTNWRSVMGEEG